MLLGSFVVPVAFVAWTFEHWRDELITTELIASAFIVGGLLGVLGASVLETNLLQPSMFVYLGVGLIEEAAKLAALVIIAPHLSRWHTRDGIVLGATVCFGFAAFETAGYAFNAMLTVNGMSLMSLVETELLRGVLSPFGHPLLDSHPRWHAVREGSRRPPARVRSCFLRVGRADLPPDTTPRSP